MNKIYFNYNQIKKIRKQILNKYKKADKNAVEQILFKIIYPDIDSNIIKETLKIRESVFSDCFLEIKKNMLKSPLNLLDKYKYIYVKGIIEATQLNSYILDELNKYGFQLNNIDFIQSYLNKMKVQLKSNPISYSLTDYLKLFYFLNTGELKSISLNDINQEDIQEIVNITKNEMQENKNSREMYFFNKMKKENIIYKEGLILKWIEESASIQEILIRIKDNLYEEYKMKNNYRLDTNIIYHDYLKKSLNKSNLNINIELGKRTCIMGSAGCGKSILACKLLANEIDKGNNFLIISNDFDFINRINFFINTDKNKDVFYTTASYLHDNNKTLNQYFNNNKTVVLNMNYGYQEKKLLINRLLKEIEGTKTKLYVEEIEYIDQGIPLQSSNSLINKIKSIKNDILIAAQDSSLIEIFNDVETDFIFGKMYDVEKIKSYNGSLRDFYNLKTGNFIMKRNNKYIKLNLELDKETPIDIVYNSSYLNLIY